MVFIHIFYTGCLSQVSYYVESDGVAAIIDPIRDPKPYVEFTKSRNSVLKYIIETHFHADFVSGHRDLARLMGAEIILGPNAKPSFPCRVVEDGEVLHIGKDVTLTAIHTPGHTMESTVFYLKTDGGTTPYSIFTGDTLFIGDVGRPDLAQTGSKTKYDLARMLFKTLRTKIMTLPPHILVYPGHRAGSACGKNISTETFSTLENQLKTNYYLQHNMTEAEFVESLTTGLPVAPDYFPKVVAQNKGAHDTNTGGKSHDEIVHIANTTPISPFQLRDMILLNRPSILVLDTRDAPDFIHDGSIPGSVFAGINGNFATNLANAFPDITRKVVIVAISKDRITEIADRLTRVGYNDIIGHLDGGFDGWKNAGLPLCRYYERITPKELASQLDSQEHNNLFLIDARKPGELTTGYCIHAKNIPLGSHSFPLINKDQDVIIFCQGGYRSLIFMTALRDNGHRGKLIDVAGGFMAMKEEGGMSKHLKGVKITCATAPCSLSKL
eukprot:Tbor_TRINITY_DN5814_c0_g1::TRINITY_DN5814_c0_g1_i1::g.6827::m.6827